MNKKKLILTVGLPRSGKSTWAKNSGYPVVNRDSIRLALHGHPFIQEMEDFVSYFEEKMVDSLFNAGHETIVIDATHTKLKYIEKWMFKGIVQLEYFLEDVDVLKKRAKETRKEFLIPVIDRMIEETDVQTLMDYYRNER